MGSYRKGFRLTLGSIVQTEVDLHSVLPTRKSGLRMLCPEHHIPLKQGYTCFNDTEGHKVDQPVKGAQVAEGWRIVNPDEKPSVERVDALELIPVPVKELEGHTVHGDGFYYCQPSSAISLEAWAVLHRILTKGKVALVARGALRKDSQKIWRLGVFRDYLVLQEIVFPDEVRATPERVDVKITRPMQQLVDQFVEQLQVGWEDFDSTDTSKEEVQKWIDSSPLVEVGPPLGDVKSQVAKVLDLQAALRKAVGK